MKLIQRTGEAPPFKLVSRVFPYRRTYRWIVTDAMTQGYGMVLAHGQSNRYDTARAQAREKIQELQQV